ncbi:hypothetical protein JTE90_014944 [Oedothorax gibbosus]|uniref:Uncharacterized protein n=1 Tax=Oedothorax gibbosus TaxID=931172 RepID=A0AAV6UXL6_9ARAC|nr:hypothetical protein JTE90_014944 [Oedothorax gibbosus]
MQTFIKLYRQEGAASPPPSPGGCSTWCASQSCTCAGSSCACEQRSGPYPSPWAPRQTCETGRLGNFWQTRQFSGKTCWVVPSGG